MNNLLLKWTILLDDTLNTYVYEYVYKYMCTYVTNKQSFFVLCCFCGKMKMAALRSPALWLSPTGLDHYRESYLENSWMLVYEYFVFFFND